MQQLSGTKESKTGYHTWKDQPPSDVESFPTVSLLNLYSILMATERARAHTFKVTAKDSQQFVTPDMNTTLEAYQALLDIGAIKISADCWPELVKDIAPEDLELEHLMLATLEVNFGTRLTNNNVCSIIKKEFVNRLKRSESDHADAGFQCWSLLNQAYCFNAISYRHETYHLTEGKRDFTTSEYIDLQNLSAQLAAGWINALCRRAFNWTAGKQKESGLSDEKAADMAIGSVIRQLTWATEEEPIGEMYTRPKALVAFGIERMLKDLFGVDPETLFILKPNADFLLETLNSKYKLR